MKTHFSILALSILLFGCKQKTDFSVFKNSQDYTVPLFEDNFKNKTALFILPHSDDEVVFGGAITHLKKSGWKVNLVTLTQGQTQEEKDTRKAEWNNSVKLLGFDQSEILDLTNNSWENVLQNKITFWYTGQDSLQNIIYSRIKLYQPSLLFTYDTAFGAYGHPEHRISALAAFNVFNKYKSDSLFPVERILQVTLPEKQEQMILANAESYQNAIKFTGNKTLPEPNVSFDISKYWNSKRGAAQQYPSQAGTLRKFFLLPEDNDTTEHYNSFDREYYFEIKK